MVDNSNVVPATNSVIFGINEEEPLQPRLATNPTISFVDHSYQEHRYELEEQQRLQKQYAEAQVNLVEQQPCDMAMALLDMSNPAILARFLRLAQLQPPLPGQQTLPLVLPTPPITPLQIQIPQMAAAVSVPNPARDVTNGEIFNGLLMRLPRPAHCNGSRPQAFNHNGFSNGNGFMGASSSTPQPQQLRTLLPHMHSIDNNDDVPNGSGTGNRGQKDPKFSCHCGKKYMGKAALYRHSANECGDKKPRHKCPHCSYAAKQRSNLGRHLRDCHPNMPPLPIRQKLKRDKSSTNSGSGSGANLNDSGTSFQNDGLDLTNNGSQHPLEYSNTTNIYTSNSDGSLYVAAAHGAQSTLLATESVVHVNGASAHTEVQSGSDQALARPACVFEVNTEYN